jgi:hypothetical protein
MKVRFLTDYQGQHTGPHFYLTMTVDWLRVFEAN